MKYIFLVNFRNVFSPLLCTVRHLSSLVPSYLTVSGLFINLHGENRCTLTLRKPAWEKEDRPVHHSNINHKEKYILYNKFTTLTSSPELKMASVVIELQRIQTRTPTKLNTGVKKLGTIYDLEPPGKEARTCLASSSLRTRPVARYICPQFSRTALRLSPGIDSRVAAAASGNLASAAGFCAVPAPSSDVSHGGSQGELRVNPRGAIKLPALCHVGTQRFLHVSPRVLGQLLLHICGAYPTDPIAAMEVPHLLHVANGVFLDHAAALALCSLHFIDGAQLEFLLTLAEIWRNVRRAPLHHAFCRWFNRLKRHTKLSNTIGILNFSWWISILQRHMYVSRCLLIEPI